jgi:hypothetical protein
VVNDQFYQWMAGAALPSIVGERTGNDKSAAAIDDRGVLQYNSMHKGHSWSPHECPSELLLQGLYVWQGVLHSISTCFTPAACTPQVPC